MTIGPITGDTFWAAAAVTGNLPAHVMKEDAEAGGYLALLLQAFESELDEVRDLMAALPRQRDALLARMEDVVLTTTITAATLTTDSTFGVCMAVEVAASTLNVFPGWTLEADGVEYTILRVRSRGDAFTLHLRARAVPAWSLPVAATITLPATLPRLAADMGVKNDKAESEVARRGAVRHAVRYLEWKSTEAGYAIRGSIAGFTVNPLGLYTVPLPWTSTLPANRTYYLGSRWYTDIEPRFLRADDLSLDAFPLDGLAIYEDSSPDGMSIAMAVAEEVATVVITATAPFSPIEVATWGMDGHHVTATLSAADRMLFNVTGPNLFSLVDVDGNELILEGEISYADPDWHVAIATPDAPALGSYRVRYHPELAHVCNWCKSSALRFEIEASQETIDHYGSPEAVDRAQSAVIEKLKTLVPIHVSVVEFAVVRSGAITGPEPTVSATVDVALESYLGLTLYFDAVPLDVEILDWDTGPTVAAALVVT